MLTSKSIKASATILFASLVVIACGGADSEEGAGSAGSAASAANELGGTCTADASKKALEKFVGGTLTVTNNPITLTPDATVYSYGYASNGKDGKYQFYKVGSLDEKLFPRATCSLEGSEPLVMTKGEVFTITKLENVLFGDCKDAKGNDVKEQGSADAFYMTLDSSKFSKDKPPKLRLWCGSTNGTIGVPGALMLREKGASK